MISLNLFRTPELVDAEIKACERIKALRSQLRHLVSEPKRWTGLLRKTALARAIRASNSIEGYDVDRDDAIAAAEGDEPFDAAGDTWKAVNGYRQAMTYVLQLSEDDHFEYGANLLRPLHFMMTEYDLNNRPGRWRLGPVFVQKEPSGDIVYEGPPAEHVPELINRLIEWINTGDLEYPPTVRAAMAHLNLVMIHPFKDGNGRMSRCLQTLVLAREGILSPDFCSIEEYLRKNTDEYYEMLSRVGGKKWNPDGDARPWMRFVLNAHYRQALELLRRHEEMQNVFGALEKLLERYRIRERSLTPIAMAAFGHKIRNSTYRNNADVSNSVATRDLNRLVEAGLLIAKGERRGRFYLGTEELLKIRRDLRKPRTNEDLFTTEQRTG